MNCAMLQGDPPRTCDWCATHLPRRKDGKPHANRRWCSRECSDEWARQHVWQLARRAALVRDDYRCVRRAAHENEDAVRTELDPKIQAVRERMDALDRDDPERWALLDEVTDLTDERAQRIGTTLDLEVNHIEPRRGEGYSAGCHHHLDNLETLCHECHVEVTTAQRRGWEGSARNLPPEPDQLSLGVAS